MNIIRMTGGLGNQMFQYALYLKFRSMGRDVKMDDITEYALPNARPIMLWVFDIEYPKADRKEINYLTDGSLQLVHRIRRKLFGRKSLEYQEKDCNFDLAVLEKYPAYLTGYFQTEKYFEDIAKQVRDAFSFSDKIWEGLDLETAEKLKAYEKQIEDTPAIAVHIRRGDYLETSAVYGGICTEAYYETAISLMKEKVPGATFFVFSNDVHWASDWAKRMESDENSFIVVEGTTEDTGYLDLLLMSRCRHYIIANSSFSWWGAWLGTAKDKCVIAPSKWLNGKEYTDIYTKDMIKVSPSGEVKNV